MNELLELLEKLQDKYSSYGFTHWEVVKAEKTEKGWNLEIKPEPQEGEDESNK